jgi:surface protein
MATIINNDNIRELVAMYCHKKNKRNLPRDLMGKSINDWDVSRVTNMEGLFLVKFENKFNEPLNNWDVSNVTNMGHMFRRCANFNQSLNDWKVSKVTNMRYMFDECVNFNEPLNDWIVSNVTTMENMFTGCTNFNKPLNNWDVQNVTNMAHMFTGCTNFNKPLNSWIVSNVVNMMAMFAGCVNFDEPLNSWIVSNVVNMMSMFAGCEKFNKPLNNWNVQNVTYMAHMFENCYNFNQNLNNWDISNVNNDMGDIFTNCPITEENKPQGQVQQQQRIQVDPLHVHRVFAKIPITALIRFIKTTLDPPSSPPPPASNYNDYIRITINSMIDETSNPLEKKQQFNYIMVSHLNGLNFRQLSPVLLEAIYYTLEFVKRQPLEFKNSYLSPFLSDCVNAYEGPQSSRMSCAGGILEQMVYSLYPACESEISKKDTSMATEINKKRKFGEEETDNAYNEIVEIFQSNPVVLCPLYIKEWYQIYNIANKAKNPGFYSKSDEEKKQILKDYLMEKLPDQAELIDSNIAEYTDAIGLDEDSFTYGGKRRTKRKSIRKKTTKRKTKKRRTKRKTRKRD